MRDCCGTWPEQNAVDAWLEKHGIEVERKVRLELKEAVTECRLRIQEERDGLRARIAELEGQVRMLLTLLRNIEEFAVYCPVCGDDFYDHTSDWCDFKQALSTPPPARWEAMQRVVEAAEGLCKTAAGAYNPKRTSISKVAFIKLKEALAAPFQGGGDGG
jgi:hypothetical protein